MNYQSFFLQNAEIGLPVIYNFGKCIGESLIFAGDHYLSI